MPQKSLIIRLSSLGDVVISTAALEANINSQWVDWGISNEYSQLIQGHPRVREVLVYNRSSGFRGWLLFCRMVWESQYDVIYDLHRSLRTRLMRVLFFVWGFPEFLENLSGRRVRAVRPPRWFAISKQRPQYWGYFIFKKFWPPKWRPTPWVVQFSRTVGGTGSERPNLSHLIRNESFPKELEVAILESAIQDKSRWICVMPSSRWRGKNWPISYYVELLAELPVFPVILGMSTDQNSLQLCKELEKKGIPFFSGVGKWNLKSSAKVLSQSQGYLGGDTGLSHLAEAVGVPSTVIFGPTTPDMGFGPWRKESRSVALSLGCRPCSKDGESCYRVTQKHHCLSSLSAKNVLNQLR